MLVLGHLPNSTLRGLQDLLADTEIHEGGEGIEVVEGAGVCGALLVIFLVQKVNQAEEVNVQGNRRVSGFQASAGTSVTENDIVCLFLKGS